jgi:uncharacterized membrane protein (UPF0127 family)
MTLRAFVATAAAFLAACAGAAEEYPASFAMLEQAEVRAVTASGTHRFKVWIAADDASRQQGLMFVRRLPPDRGMLFVFDAPQQAAFWMKDTYLSLDLVFIDPTGAVANIAANAKPESLDPLFSHGPVIAVLEVPAGTAQRIQLGAGDRFLLPTLRTTSSSGPAKKNGARRRLDAAVGPARLTGKTPMRWNIGPTVSPFPG